MADNEFIESGYRVDYDGCAEITTTLCKCHNEAVNVWTHVVGSFIMLVFAILIVVFHEDHESVGQIGWQRY